MDRVAEMLLLVASAAALAGWAAYRWACRGRSARVRGWVRDHLAGRHGGSPPGNLDIACSDDRLWPVLVSFDAPGGGRTHLRFFCPGGRDSIRQVAKW